MDARAGNFKNTSNGYAKRINRIEKGKDIITRCKTNNRMKIIIRTCGERTTNECIRLAERQGEVDVINAVPFGESIRQTYLKAMGYNQIWVPVIDADVLLYDNVLQPAVDELRQKNDKIFCLDGNTDDKILMKKRRAGIHIYRHDLLNFAMRFIDNDHIKPESNIRRQMSDLGFPTFVSGIVFGRHDYEQYYCDLWRKAVCQTRKLEKMIKDRPAKWKELAKEDDDFFVIYHAHYYGKSVAEKIVIDKRQDFDAEENIKKLGLKEKGKYENAQ